MLVVVNTIQSPGHISAGVAQYTFSHDLHLSASHTWHIHIHSLSPRSPSPKWCLLFCFRAFTRDSSKSFNYLFVNDNKEGGSHVAKMSWKWFKYRIKNVKQSKYFWGKKTYKDRIKVPHLLLCRRSLPVSVREQWIPKWWCPLHSENGGTHCSLCIFISLLCILYLTGSRKEQVEKNNNTQITNEWFKTPAAAAAVHGILSSYQGGEKKKHNHKTQSVTLLGQSNAWISSSELNWFFFSFYKWTT